MIENDDPKISILYDGIYSDRLKWQTDRLAEFANRSDLRTYVHIVTGDAIDRPQITVLGDILAWRSILSAANPFSKSSGLGKPLEVFNSQTEGGRIDAHVVINHQILIDKVKKQNTGKITPQSYAHILDREVKSGLRQILIAEKWDLLRYTGGVMGLYVGGMAVAPLLEHLQLEAVQMINPGSAGAMVESIYRFLEFSSQVGEYIATPVVTAAGIYRYREMSQAISDNPGQYIMSLRDMNPMKYPVEAYLGLSYLKRQDKPLVDLE